MKSFKLNGNQYEAKALISNILIDPKLPDGFWTTPICERSSEELELWEFVPFIITLGDLFKGYCLDGGAWDRPSLLNASDDLTEIIEHLTNYAANN